MNAKILFVLASLLVSFVAMQGDPSLIGQPKLMRLFHPFKVTRGLE